MPSPFASTANAALNVVPIGPAPESSIRRPSSKPATVQVTSPGMPMILTFSLKDSPSRISSGVPSGKSTCRVIHCP